MDDIFNQAGMHDQLKNLIKDGKIEDSAVVLYIEPAWTKSESSKSVGKEQLHNGLSQAISGFFQPRTCIYNSRMREYEEEELRRKQNYEAEATFMQ